MDYYSVPHISNSSLNYIDEEMGGCPEMMKKYLDGLLKQKTTKYLTLGQAVHTALLEPDLLKIVDFEAPTDKIREAVMEVFHSLENTDISIDSSLDKYKEEILSAVNKINFQSRWKDETRVNKVIEEGSEYFFHMINAGDGYILDSKQNENLSKIKYNIVSNPTAENILKDIEGYESLTEQEIFWKERPFENEDFTLDCKAKLDRLLIDHKRKRFHILDVKTTSKSLHEFRTKVFNERKYYRQIAFYERAANEFLKKNYKETQYKPGTHYILTVQTDNFFNVRVFDIALEKIQEGHDEIVKLLLTLAHHYRSGNWIRPLDAEGEEIRIITLS